MIATKLLLDLLQLLMYKQIRAKNYHVGYDTLQSSKSEPIFWKSAAFVVIVEVYAKQVTNKEQLLKKQAMHIFESKDNFCRI
jgi:hypothetical protein